MKFTHLLLIVFALCSSAAVAQPRPPEVAEKPKNIAAAPTTFNARYEGGIHGYNTKESGTLKFDDENERFVFFGLDGKERFGIPYKSFLIVYPGEKSVTSTAGNVVGVIVGSGIGDLIREKRRYLVIQYDDPDVEAKGATSFKVETKELLDSVIHALGKKASLKPRGEAFVRPRKTETN